MRLNKQQNMYQIYGIRSRPI